MRQYKRKLIVTDEQKAQLLQLVANYNTPQFLARRARMILMCDEGMTLTEVARRLDCSLQNVAIWRNRFIDAGVDALYDAPRSGRPRIIDDAKVEAIITKTLESTPPGQTHWSQRQMAAEVDVSRESVGRMWRAFGLKPHLSKTFRMSTDPLFVEKVRDVVGLYLNPPDRALVLSVDEKTQIQAKEWRGPVLPMQPGQPEGHPSVYTRHGITNLFAALDVATGRVITACAPKHSSQEFVSFLKIIDEQTDPELDLHIIVDNYGVHKSSVTRQFLRNNPRFTLHFVPTYSSWLTMVEGFFSILQRRALERGNFNSVEDLKATILEFIEAHNKRPTKFTWIKTADQILGRLKDYYQTLYHVKGAGDMNKT